MPCNFSTVCVRIVAMNNPSSHKIVQKEISILLADDHPLFRKAVRSVLEKQPEFKVVAEAANGIEAVQLSIQLVPDLVIMDISMPELNGLEAMREIKKECPQICVLVLTVHSDIEHIMSILEAGAAGYLTKSADDDEVIAAVYSVIAGETVIASHIFKEVLKRRLQYPFKRLILKGAEELTVREIEVLKLAAKGFSNKDIALGLNLSLRTVKGYMVEIFTKLNVTSRTEAVITALRAGIINSDDIEK